MPHTIAEIAAALGLMHEGDGTLQVTGLAEPATARPDELALAMTPDYAAALKDGGARAALLWQDADWRALGLGAAILPPRPRFTLAALSARLDPGQGYAPGIHAGACVDPSAEIGADVAIGPFTVVDPGARIGAGSVIGPHCHIGRDARIGEDALIHSHVTISARVAIGARFVAQPGARIGGDGFSFVTPEPSDAERARAALAGASAADGKEIQPWARIHSLGAVRIGDDVEIGANSTIDRGTVRDTILGDGCKLDNLVQIGHNVVAGRHVLFCAQAAVAGSAVIGDGVVLGGKSGVSDNITVGDRVVLGGASIVLTNIPSGRVMLGYPAMKIENHIESYKALRRLPRALRDLAALKKAVSKLGGND
jgi:UDP-3-O-[3-hydroxymyristoyl] glucosamine N-acyltransferase